MKRIFTAVALQSVVAAATLAMAPLASADPVQDPLVPAPSASLLSRAEVRQAAIEARDARQRSPQSGETALDPTSAPFVSTVSRAQVRAEAVEAVRLGVTSNYDGKSRATAEQLAQIRSASLRATAAQDLVAAKQ